MSEKPLVSILLLSMNHELFIQQCIESLKDQTYKNIEVVYLDNASSDATFNLGKKLLEESGLQYKIFYKKESQSISKNLNFLLANSSGKYISPLSTDDWFAPQNIEKKVSFFLNNPGTGSVFSNGWFYYQNDHTCLLNDSSTFKRGHLYREVLNNPDCVFYVGMMYSREVFEKVGGWDERLMIEDTDMYVRISMVADINYINEPLTYYRRTSASASKNKKFMLEGYYQYYEKYKTAKWINMKRWLAERHRLFATDCIDNKKNKEATAFLFKAIKINPLSLKHFRTMFYLIRQSL